MFNEIPVSENNYSEKMKEIVEPYLKEIGEEGFFEGFDKSLIHYESYIIGSPKGSVVISHGFTESAEKFREMSYYFTLMGYNVFAIDHRGHGKSERITEDPATVSVNHFSDYVNDLNIFVNRVVKVKSGKLPLYLYSHSMGGAVAIQYLQEYPYDFKKAILSSPMVMPQCHGMKPGAARALTAAFCALGQKNKQVFVYDGFNPDITHEQSHDTSKARFDYYHEKRKNDETLQTASASYRWVMEAVGVSKKNLDIDRCKRIKVPVLICQPESDSSVYSDKEDKFLTLIPNGIIKKFVNCRHEIYMSVDDTVLEYINEIEAFLCC